MIEIFACAIVYNLNFAVSIALCKIKISKMGPAVETSENCEYVSKINRCTVMNCVLPHAFMVMKMKKKIAAFIGTTSRSLQKVVKNGKTAEVMFGSLASIGPHANEKEIKSINVYKYSD